MTLSSTLLKCKQFYSAGDSEQPHPFIRYRYLVIREKFFVTNITKIVLLFPNAIIDMYPIYIYSTKTFVRILFLIRLSSPERLQNLQTSLVFMLANPYVASHVGLRYLSLRCRIIYYSFRIINNILQFCCI